MDPMGIWLTNDSSFHKWYSWSFSTIRLNPPKIQENTRLPPTEQQTVKAFIPEKACRSKHCELRWKCNPNFCRLSLQSQKHSIAFPNWNHFWELWFWITIFTMNDLKNLSWLGLSWFHIVIISAPPLGKKLLDGTALKSTFSGSLDSSPFESFTLERKIWTSRGSREIDWGSWGLTK